MALATVRQMQSLGWWILGILAVAFVVYTVGAFLKAYDLLRT